MNDREDNKNTMVLILEKFEIYNLFGLFSYEKIEFKSEEEILIIYGLNGTGKTTILKLISDFKKGHFIDIANVNFKCLKLYFNDLIDHKKLNVVIERHSSDELDISIFENSTKVTSYIINPKQILYSELSSEDISRLRYLRNRYIHSEMPEDYLKENFKDMFSNIQSSVNINNIYEYLDAISDPKIRTQYTNKFGEKKYKKFIEYISQIRDSFKCYFILAQRLDVSKYENIQAKSVILDKKKKLKTKIDENLKEYTKVSQTLDKDLVERIINSIEKTSDMTLEPEEDSYFYSDVKNALTAFVNKQNAYNKTGLDTSDSVKIDLLNSFQKAMEWDDEFKTAILFRILKNVILSDGKKKLEVFDDLYQRIDLFKELINSHLSKPKKFEIDYKEGFLVKNSISDEDIDIELLSSGEKHIIILFFELVFETEPYTLILIDEPEISLHVDWQIKFIKNLLMIKSSKIDELKNVRFILATHSPQIIHDRWDLTIELKTED